MISDEVIGDIVIQEGNVVDHSSYIDMINDLDKRLNDVHVPEGVLNDFEAADFVNTTIKMFKASER